MIVELLIGQLFLVLFNIINSRIDAYRIMKHKHIAHAVNFTVYIIFITVLCFILKIPLQPSVVFFLSAFFNRQISFDVPLNLRRGLNWYYQSEDTPPKAVLDRIERFLFGTGETIGKAIFAFYFGAYCATIASFIIFYGN